MDVKETLTIMQLILAFCNICLIGYGFYKFLNKPHSNLESRHAALEKRVDEHDIKIKEVEESLRQGNDRFREQEQTNATFKSVMLAFVDFEIAYCLHTNYEFTEDLKKAKKELQEYLAKN